MRTVLIIGCGDIGRRVARRHLRHGDYVTGLVRSQAGAQRLAAEGVLPLVTDLDSDDAPLPEADLVYHFAPPPGTGTRDTRTERLLSRLPAPVHLVYISTSGVYGDHQGAWVDETTPPNPQTDRARRRLDAERRLLAWGRQEAVSVVILRVGGIYGPGRLPIDRLDQVTVICPDEAPYTNRIHADDLAAVCVAAAEHGEPGGIYNVADDEPGTLTEYFYQVADAVGRPRPPCVSLQAAPKHLSPGMLSYVRESRRMRTDKMKTLGIQLRYPGLKDGLAASLADPDA